ncbi:SDR family oxidoreductase [Rhizobium sp. RU36D]|uniref:SDR family oxidoreductase n=1 Tax=Rhizobium sp. RU36D TaxID=1907415 RepID=UPI0009D85FE2|nr:SDR family oxidoreductase [Rhizobium sp. RU36D]SMC96778.1 Saccharopine dehydrogenase NADP binding domain-containing protein [Rhizobium sp. RU36D]
MTRVMVLGGYGGFGARLSRRLAAEGWTVLVAGRNGDKAQAMAQSLPGAVAIVADRNGDFDSVLRAQKPVLLIDAAGPFQGSGYHVAEACIRAGVHYIDLADARDFVLGIGALDDAARRAGVAVVSGASSVPALSGAVLRQLTEGLDTVRSVSMALSASSKASAGASVAAAILSYVGKPVRLWRGRRWQVRTGWQMVKRERYEISGSQPISRLVALSDVPDHQIVPDGLPGRPATIFRAGPEFSFQLFSVWLLGWFVRWGWLTSAVSLAPYLLPLQALTSRFGSDRSAMAIEVKGVAAGAGRVRRWTLIAERGDGPEIPTLAAPLIARAIVDGGIAPGARSSEALLQLADFQPAFDGLAIRHETTEKTYVPLYRRVLAADFARTPAPVQALHDVIGDGSAAGRAVVTRGTSLLARLACAIIGFPPTGEHALHVDFEEEDGIERWTRDFAGRRFSSELSQSGHFLVERFGPLRFHFTLEGDETGLRMRMQRWFMFGLPLPLWLAPKSEAREWAEGDQFCFDVAIALPGIGAVVHYRGWLRVV